jgi:hypothetical protein
VSKISESLANCKLVETMNNGTVRYVALSYCWGVALQPGMTTSKVYESYKAFIPRANLPRTIQDAIAVTQHIGFEYLWVDSLCIIQNDKDDKNAEIGRMQDSFGGATLTISAASAEACWDGFLEERRLPTDVDDWDLRFVPYQLPYLNPDDTLGNLTIEPNVSVQHH